MKYYTYEHMIGFNAGVKAGLEKLATDHDLGASKKEWNKIVRNLCKKEERRLLRMNK